jgi:hypothetical protein
VARCGAGSRSSRQRQQQQQQWAGRHSARAAPCECWLLLACADAADCSVLGSRPA